MNQLWRGCWRPHHRRVPQDSFWIGAQYLEWIFIVVAKAGIDRLITRGEDLSPSDNRFRQPLERRATCKVGVCQRRLAISWAERCVVDSHAMVTRLDNGLSFDRIAANDYFHVVACRTAMRDPTCNDQVARVVRRDVILAQRHLHACGIAMSGYEAGDVTSIAAIRSVELMDEIKMRNPK
jgi:hypothetical protein